MINTVRLYDNTVGQIITDNITDLNKIFDLHQEVTISLRDENGNRIYRDGIIEEILS